MGGDTFTLSVNLSEYQPLSILTHDSAPLEMIRRPPDRHRGNAGITPMGASFRGFDVRPTFKKGFETCRERSADALVR